MTFNIATRSSWGARYRNGVGNRATGKLEVYFHHSVTKHLPATATVAQEREQMRVLEQVGQSRFGAGISYNVVIFPSGRAYWGATGERISYHSGAGRNTRGLSICLAGNYDVNPITSTVENAVANALKELARQKLISPTRIKEAHREFAATACPGKYAFASKGKINNLAATSAAPKPVPAPKPPAGGSTYTVVRGDTLSGIAHAVGSTVAELSKLNGIKNANQIKVGQKLKLPAKPKPPATKGLSSSTKSKLKAMGLPQTVAGVKSYQKAHGLWPDGDWGKVTNDYHAWVKSLQSALNRWKAVQRLGKLRVDGYRGSLTKRAEKAVQTPPANRKVLGTTKASLYKGLGIKPEPRKIG